MATLKEHQAAMVDLLASGSGIPASTSRLAHAMHDVLDVMANSDLMQFVQKEQIRVRELNDATTPGLNDKALSKREKALKTDSPAKWPTPAEQRVKELENTIKQLKANLVKVRGERDMLHGRLLEHEHPTEQAGCRKEDTQLIDTDFPDCWHKWVKAPLGDYEVCAKCGLSPLDAFGPNKKVPLK